MGELRGRPRPRHRQLGSGRSVVSDRFNAQGVRIVDADVAARTVAEPGEPALAEIVDHFGPGVLHDAGRLDGRKLRSLVFQEPRERRWLERALQPRINALMRDQLAEAGSAYVTLVNPLMRNRVARKPHTGRRRAGSRAYRAHHGPRRCRAPRPRRSWRTSWTVRPGSRSPTT